MLQTKASSVLLLEATASTVYFFANNLVLLTSFEQGFKMY